MSDASIDKRIAAVMAEMKTFPRDAKHHQGYAYVSADAFYEAARPLLGKHGLVPLHQPGEIETLEHRGVEFLIQPVTLWFDGETDRATYRVPLNTTTKSGVRLDAQLLQAAITYGIKYWLRGRLLAATGEPDADAGQQQDVPAPPSVASEGPGIEIMDDVLMTSDGKTLTGWVAEDGRAAQARIYSWLSMKIRLGEAALIILNNVEELRKVIPEAGRKMLAKELEKKGETQAAQEIMSNAPAPAA